ncbi:MAG: sialidase family protein [Kiritimatiellales bacterium]
MNLNKTKCTVSATSETDKSGCAFLGDWRQLENGTVIPISSGYADQPFFTRADDGALVLICTTCRGTEGEAGQHIVSIRSTDNGATWEAPVAIEPPTGVEASYAVMLKAGSGRIYAFYNHNTDNIRQIPGDKEAYPDGWCRRVDSLGYFVLKYSDDHGKSWSAQRYVVPVREFEIDRENTVGGKIRYFWNVGKPFVHATKGYVPLHKVGGFGVDFFTRSEGVLLCSNNIMTETDPGKICWETLPDGDVGLRAPEGGGPIAEEQSFAVLSDGTFFCVFRTVSGYSSCSYSRDHGRTWSRPDFMRYADGRRMKNSRSATFIWKLAGNRYFYWMNNHSGRSYADRNPIWFSAAKEVNVPGGKILEFSQPEILLYNDDITRRSSYPDLMEMDDGSLLYTETEKQTARMHRIPAGVVERVFNPAPPPESDRIVAGEKLPIFYDREGGWEVISGKDTRNGFSIELVIAAGAQPGVLLDNRTATGRGFAVRLNGDQKLEILINDMRSESHWTSTEALDFKKENHAVIVIDGGPKTISMIINGQFDDGGETRQFGFGLFHRFFQSANGGEVRADLKVKQFTLYRRALFTGEAVELYKKEMV